MKTLLITLLSLSIFLSSCFKPREVKEISTPQLKIIEPVDALVTGDPIDFYNTKMLVFPVGGLHYEFPPTTKYPQEINIKNKNFFSSSTVANLYDDAGTKTYRIVDESSQEVKNLIFYNKFSKEKYLLTDSALSILSFSVHKEFKEHLIFYEIVKNDINKDSIKNSLDGKILYVSKTNGKDFIQLSPDNEMYLDYFFYPETNTMLIKSVLDSNKDGFFADGEETRFTEVDLNNISLGKDIFTDDFKDVLKNMTLDKNK